MWVGTTMKVGLRYRDVAVTDDATVIGGKKRIEAVGRLRRDVLDDLQGRRKPSHWNLVARKGRAAIRVGRIRRCSRAVVRGPRGRRVVKLLDDVSAVGVSAKVAVLIAVVGTTAEIVVGLANEYRS